MMVEGDNRMVERDKQDSGGGIIRLVEGVKQDGGGGIKKVEGE